MDKLVSHTPAEIHKIYTPDAQKAISTFIYKRLCALDNYDCDSLPPLRTPITLLKPTASAVAMPDDAYGLRKVTATRFLRCGKLFDYRALAEY